MRIALSVIASVAVSSVALAQTTAPETPPAAPVAPAAVSAPPVAEAPPAAEPAKPEPTLPTSGDGAEVVQIVQGVCMPLVKGGDWAQLAQAAGMKKAKKQGIQVYVKQLGAEKTYSITLEPQGSNREICTLTLNYALDGEKPIISALNIWSYLHDPYMAAQRNDYAPATDYKRITNSWEYFTDHESQGLVFLQLKKPDGTSVNAKFDLATVLYSERKF